MEKFAIKCDNNEEFKIAQKYLFLKNFKWRDTNKEVFSYEYFPIIITQNIIGENNLIFHRYNCDIDIKNKYMYNSEYLTFIDIKTIIRKYKLLKLENENK